MSKICMNPENIIFHVGGECLDTEGDKKSRFKLVNLGYYHTHIKNIKNTVKDFCIKIDSSNTQQFKWYL